MISKLFRRTVTSGGRKTNRNGLLSKCCAVIGAQWGDEGKGKLVDILANEYDICARYNGGANAGHTVKVQDKKYIFHLLPCGMLYPKCVNVLGNGVVIHLPTMFEEIKQLEDSKISWDGRLLLSNRAHLITQMHTTTDAVLEKSGNIGTTKRGIGPAYTMKMLRKGLRIGDLADWAVFEKKYLKLYGEMKEFFKFEDYDTAKELEELKKLQEIIVSKNMIIDCVDYLHNAIKSKKRLLVEGANATMLDIDHGTYPFVTSSSTNVGGACTGLGIPPDAITSKIGVVKAYTTRVGGGPFPTELLDHNGEYLQTTGQEFGATTGRKRRCGWLDLNVVRYAHKINNFESLIITKLDILNKLPEIKVATGYKINGTLLPDVMPSTIEELSKVEVVYQTLPGWNVDISNIKKFKELPIQAKHYIT